MHLVRHLRRAPYESPAAPMSNNATDFVFSTGSKYARIIRSQVEIRRTLLLREWTGRRTLFLPARNCKLVVQSFAASDDTTTGTGGRERARETGKLQMERKKESRRKKRHHFVRASHFFLCRHCTTRDYDVKFPYATFYRPRKQRRTNFPY